MRFILLNCLCLLPFLTACHDDDVVSMTIEQRAAQTIPGLGLRGAVAIHIDDIETGDSPFRRGTSIEELSVETADAVLARKENVGLLDLIPFTHDGVTYEIRIEGFESNLVFNDEVDLIVYRK
jgi:hypothetical protein